MRVTVLMGGDSEERDVSLASGVQVARALREAGHEVVAFDTETGPLSEERQAELLEAGVGTSPSVRTPPSTGPAQGRSVRRILDAPEVTGADIVFPTLHGGWGEDGTLQALLEWAGVPFVGSDMTACAVAMDKDLSKRLLRAGGVGTPDWVVADEAEAVLGQLEPPVIVKPVSGGSSVLLEKAADAEQLEAALDRGREAGRRMMAEAMVSGREFTVGIVGDEALPVGEIIPQHELFDYECKYQPGMAQEIFPAEVAPALAELLREEALRTHRLLGMRDFSRVDFMVDGEGRSWCLEANTLPGMTANSLLPRAGRAAGLDFSELCDRIVRIALDRNTGVRDGV